ncbi:class I SAM-dependent methyltransferase [Salmonella enterica subsp. salamae]|nr:class I SAM-dependent methyltransferase [Salmonella enterica subsp. salamae]ECJ2282537.1 class I SAM-dependent methyltransferase [Salmonella enterica subsp. salamae]HCC0887148.1 class I SAM-dependent methyltransferase [Salmonella enterica]
MKHTPQSGAKIYTPFTLSLYDWWVLNISNKYAWKCPTDKRLLPFFLRHMGETHLDIGVGTGYYLKYAPATHAISLMDLNPDSLQIAANRVGRIKIRAALQHDVFETFPEDWQGCFDSVSMFYLLHCLPGQMMTKAQAIKNAGMALKPGGTLFGATILGKNVSHNAFGKKLMAIYNQKGIFSNIDDSADTLRNALDEHFTNVTLEQYGTVALFSATSPRLPSMSTAHTPSV